MTQTFISRNSIYATKPLTYKFLETILTTQEDLVKEHTATIELHRLNGFTSNGHKHFPKKHTIKSFKQRLDNRIDMDGTFHLILRTDITF